MRYIDYFIKCIIRRIVRMIFMPKIFISILFILLILTFSLYSNSYAAEFSPSTSVISSYNDVASDFVTRLFKTSTISERRNILNKLNNPRYSYYVYYGQSRNGSSMIFGPSTSPSYDSTTMYVAFYLKSVEYRPSAFDAYNGLVTPIRTTNIDDLYRINSDGSITSYAVSSDETVLMPDILFNYSSLAVSDYINNQQNFDNLNNSIQEGTDKISNSVNDTNNFIKDDNISDESMSVDTSGYDIEGEESIDNFFIEFMNTIHDKFLNMGSDVESITIPMPYGIPSIVLRSDIISKHIKDTPLYALIQVFWTYVFGSYIVRFVKRMFEWLSTGEIAEKGVFGFIQWLDNYNSIVKSWMM